MYKKLAAAGRCITVFCAFEQERLDVFHQLLIRRVGEFGGCFVAVFDAVAVRFTHILADGLFALGMFVSQQIGGPVGFCLGTWADRANRRGGVAGRADAAIVQAAALPVRVIGVG